MQVFYLKHMQFYFEGELWVTSMYVHACTWVERALLYE
jgi:hypothetical protein